MNYEIPVYKCRLVKDGKVKITATHVDCFEVATELLMKSLAGLPHEEVHVLYLNGRSEFLGISKVAQGGMHGCGVTAKEIFRGAILAGAAAIILGHNHPSGDPAPSPDDVIMTRHIAEVGKLLGLALLDHIVVCPERNRSASMSEHCS